MTVNTLDAPELGRNLVHEATMGSDDRAKLEALLSQLPLDEQMKELVGRSVSKLDDTTVAEARASLERASEQVPGVLSALRTAREARLTREHSRAQAPELELDYELLGRVREQLAREGLILSNEQAQKVVAVVGNEVSRRAGLAPNASSALTRERAEQASLAPAALTRFNY